jgi:tetratricopeptide (TPR) repeat protein
MADDTRIEELRRRVRKDPASLAFAQLAEELRRARRLMEAVAVCRAGLQMYPGFLSARVTLGRCFIDLDRLDDAEKELQKVREVAPENLVATRALAEIRDRRSVTSSQTAEILLRLRLRLPPGAPVPTSSERVVEGPDVTYDGATFEVWSNPGPSDQPPPALRPTWGLAPSGAVEGPDLTSDRETSDAVRMLAALQAWLDAIHVTRASRSA